MFPNIINILCVRTQLLNINKPLNLCRCLCHHPSTMPELQIRRWGNRESQKLTLPACKQTWNHTFCFNPGQPHHLISMYKRTSEYKRASKYKWHERLKYFICHPRKVTWQLSCRDWSLMPSWPSSAARGSLRCIWPWVRWERRQAVIWDFVWLWCSGKNECQARRTCGPNS